MRTVYLSKSHNFKKNILLQFIIPNIYGNSQHIVDVDEFCENW